MLYYLSVDCTSREVAPVSQACQLQMCWGRRLEEWTEVYSSAQFEGLYGVIRVQLPG